ncbi:MAG: hypothetical protein P4M07_09300 [Xanthobacteraceae bacterium]|nr:hypothetical protein [Xanthobacteraceae bacterium]
MFTITVTGKDRPGLFRDMLVSLRGNDLTGWRVVIAIDGDRGQEFAEIARAELQGVDFELSGNGTVLGIRLNPFRLLSRVFDAGSLLNLYLEEDLLVSPDATRLALWYHRNHRLGWACLNLVSGPCGSAGLLSNSDYPDVLFEARTFNSLGFVVRRAEWHALFRPVWMGSDQPPASPAVAGWRTHWGWDWSVYGAIADGDMVSLQPALARATHTGAAGTYTKPGFQERAFGGMEINHARDVDYRVVDAATLPHVLRSHINLHDETTARLIQLEAAARGQPR